MKTFTKLTFKKHCKQLVKNHEQINALHFAYGYPPFWKRENGFKSLCKTIIEQQVSLASAKSSFDRLENYCKEVKPEIMVTLKEEEYRMNGITRQKARYLTLLSEAILKEPDFFQHLSVLDNENAKLKLMQLKGIGHWTANVYLMVALNRLNIYPDFDIALINSIGYEQFNGNKIDNDCAKKFIVQFEPLQSIACCYYYHAYIQRKKVLFIP